MNSAPAAAASGHAATLHATALIAGCIGAALCEGFDLQAAGVAAGGIAAEFRPTPGQLGTFFSASTLGLCAGAVLGGRLSDSFGRKRTLIASIVLFGLFSLLTAACRDIHTLFWARLLTGAGLGGAFPNLLALVMESSSERRRHANVALAYSGMPFGGAVASLISMLSASAHWRVIFIVGGAAPLLLAPLLQRLLHESAEFRRVAVAPGPASEQPPRGRFREILREGRALPSLLLWVSSFLELLMLYLILSWLPTLLVGNGFSKAEAAFVQVAFNVGGGIAALAIGQLLEGRARNPSILVAFVAVPLLVLLLSQAPPALGVVTLIVFGLGCAVLAAQGFLYSSAPRIYPTLIRGVGVGAVVAFGRVGSIVGPKLGGMLKAAGHGSSQLLLDILPLVILGSVTALAFAWQIARRPIAAGTR
ncbi:MAG TPA: MFS transporter [Steroidobacteraceae bacterium]|nr:MFS transporter [Steroidobacteraceae bacterium]